MRNKLQNALLVEIMMAMLFFALCAAVLLPVYVTAHDQSLEAARLSDVLLAAQNLADESYAAAQVENKTLSYQGCTLSLTVTEERQGPGMLRQYLVKAVDDKTGEALVELPCARYLPEGEVSP